MRKIRLSSSAERRVAWGLSIFICFIIVLIFSAHNRGTGYYILVSLCSLCAVSISVLYLVSVIKVSVEIDADKHLIVHGVFDSNEKYDGAVSVKTVPVSIGLLNTRTIVLCDENGEAVCTIPTLFTSHSGVMAEPAAIELADALSLGFTPSVEKWEYDSQAMADHKAQLKAEKKAKRRNRKNGRSSFENISDSIDADNDNVNYDAMDDNR